MRSTSNLERHFGSYTSDVKAVLKEFSKSPHSNIIFKNKKGLIETAKFVKFSSQSWNYSPMQFCLDHYERQYYYPIILVCNNIGSIFQFNQENLDNLICAPDAKVIVSILSFEKE